MAYIALTQGKSALVDDQDAQQVAVLHWRVHKSGDKEYAVAGNYPSLHLMHRLILDAPDHMDVDHINGNGLDNRRANLRLCNHAQNMCNRKIHKNNKSGFKGVHWHARLGLWEAQIQVAKKKIYLGCFDDAEVAARRYDAAALLYHGPFARLNFPR